MGLAMTGTVWGQAVHQRDSSLRQPAMQIAAVT